MKPTLLILCTVVLAGAALAQFQDQIVRSADTPQRETPEVNPASGGPPIRQVEVVNFPDPQNVSGMVEVTNIPAVHTVEGTVEVENLPVAPDGGLLVACDPPAPTVEVLSDVIGGPVVLSQSLPEVTLAMALVSSTSVGSTISSRLRPDSTKRTPVRVTP